MIESLAPAFLTGLASSIGPCAAPRYLIATAVGLEEAGTATLAFLAGGSLAGYAILVCVGAGAAVWMSESPLAYALLSLCLIVAAVRTLARDHAHGDGPGSLSPSRGATLCLGASMTVLGAPCCFPIWISLGMQTAFAGTVLATTSVLSAFALGHVAPFVGAIALKAIFPGGFRGWRDISATVSGSLLAATGIFFALLG